ncbi:DUF1398 family protein [Escherichia coli]|nr:DUF1398 family protein [Escherichia coli]
MAQAAIFKEIFDQVRKDLNCELFYSELKRHNVSLYIYYLAKAGVFRWVTNIQEHQRYYYAFDNSLLFTESIQKTTQILPR